jgi:2-haloacid dehalogenase
MPVLPAGPREALRAILVVSASSDLEHTAHPRSNPVEALMSNPPVVVFDVNETLSDLSPMSACFTEVGLPAHAAALWFARLLRDGFALTAAGDRPSFASLGAEGVRLLLAEHAVAGDPEDAVQRVMAAMRGVGLHGDVVDGVRGLRAAGARLVTLTNGGTELADRLFTDADIRDEFEALLSVDDAPLWKPARASYDYASSACGVPPAAMLLVAVHPWDIHGAAQAGMRTAWLNRSGARYPDYFHAPDLTIHALTALPGRLSAVF